VLGSDSEEVIDGRVPLESVDVFIRGETLDRNLRIRAKSEHWAPGGVSDGTR
jgi:hypothetical protein